jgi:hypothetical protein
MWLAPDEPSEAMRQAAAQYAECGISANAVFAYRAMRQAHLTATEAPATAKGGE